VLNIKKPCRRMRYLLILLWMNWHKLVNLLCLSGWQASSVFYSFIVKSANNAFVCRVFWCSALSIIHSFVLSLILKFYPNWHFTLFIIILFSLFCFIKFSIQAFAWLSSRKFEW
jgi:hypothetical protein